MKFLLIRVILQLDINNNSEINRDYAETVLGNTMIWYTLISLLNLLSPSDTLCTSNFQISNDS